ncbi:LuxR C-terminal-related transcriptional regulator [Niameybacter massiliensis]|uniref:LuxR C-terminal-related transcriptional regulator n=1 Tax=Holtiella tumoricola TaxID=3018743 RepID=A0AA42IZY9_9FIRM|nr:LuxR C-terminal-related transcriptional regulator [Holtiella tumoricola]
MNKGNQIKIVGRKAKEKLLNIQEYPLTVVTAPIGYGKTLAVQNACTQSKANIEWYDEKQSAWYPKKQYTEQTWIILDNYHKIPEAYKYYEQLSEVVRQNIENLHIVLITRMIPVIGIEEMRIKNQCQIVNGEDLKLAPEEIKAYFNENGINIEEIKVKDIADYVGGWPTAIYLMKENYLQYGQLNYTYSLYKVIKEGIYNTYDEGYQKLLVTLAGIGAFKMGEWILMPNYTQVLKGIEKLLQDNLLKYDHEQECYGLVPIFIEFLKQELTLHAQGVLKGTCEYIAKWHITKKDWNTAFAFLIQSGSYEELLKCLESEGIQKYGRIDTAMLQKIFQQVDHQLFLRYPVACLRMIYYSLLDKNKQYAKNYMEQVEIGFRQITTYDDEVMNRIMGEIHAIRGIMTNETIQEVVECIERVEEYIPQGSIIVNGIDMIHKHCIHMSYRYHIQQGKYATSIRDILKIIKSHDILKQRYSIEMQYLLSAEYYLYKGECNEAKKCAYKLFYKADMAQNYVMRLCSELILARIALSKQDETKCRKYIQNIELYKHYNAGEAIAEVRKIGLWYIKGCLATPQEEFKEEEFKDILSRCYENNIGISSYIAYAQVLLINEEIIKLEILQDIVGEQLATNGSIFGQIYYYLYEAILKLKLGNVEEAKLKLKKGLEIAKEDHIILPYQEHLSLLSPLLGQLQRDHVIGEYVTEILKGVTLEPEVKEATKQVMENKESIWGLTKREFQITELIKEGLTNKQIAEKLYVANVTVAKTTSNIYKKLGVSNRIEMIRKMG